MHCVHGCVCCVGVCVCLYLGSVYVFMSISMALWLIELGGEILVAKLCVSSVQGPSPDTAILNSDRPRGLSPAGARLSVWPTHPQSLPPGLPPLS